MDDSSLLSYLVVATLGAAIGIALWQLYRVTKARREHHRSARTPAEVAQSR